MSYEISPDMFYWYSDRLCVLIDEAISSQEPKAISYIRDIFDSESWQSIVYKYNEQGSMWLFWFKSGVLKYIDIDRASTFLAENEIGN